MATAEVIHPPPFGLRPSPIEQIDDFFPSLKQSSRKRKRSCSVSMPSEILSIAGDVPAKMEFTPEKHLNYQAPSKVWTMKEIGFENKGVSSVAVSEPFPLFTKEAIQQMRAEVLSKPVLDNCQYSSNLAQCQLRGCAPEYAPFVYDVWRNPEVLSIVSKIAGIDLVPQMDFEIAHINVSINSKEQQKAADEALAEHRQRELDEGVSGCPWEDDMPIVDWHTDSYPFVCVTMLSDCTNMVGGETALRTGTGEVMKVRGPGMGSAVILQGRYIEHQALRALGGNERITMVTSFRPKSAFVKDDTVLTTVRSVSNLSELYSQYTMYRLEMLEQRIQAHLQEVREKKRIQKSFDTKRSKEFLNEQANFLASMLKELVDDDKVIKGFTDESHLLSQDLKEQSKKKAKLVVM